MKYATAISPATMKATGRVNTPIRSRAPPTVSRSPAMPANEPIGAVPPPGMIAAGNASSLAVPNCVKRNAATILRMLSRYGARAGHVATILGAVIVRPSRCQVSLRAAGSAALQQASVSQLLRACGKCVGGAAPPQVSHVLEKTRVRPERGEIFEQQRPVAAVSQYVRWESLDVAVSVQQPGRRDRSDPGNAGISVCRIAHEGEEVGNQDGVHAEFLAHALCISDFPSFAVDLHHAIVADALRQILVGRPDADLLHAFVGG